MNEKFFVEQDGIGEKEYQDYRLAEQEEKALQELVSSLSNKPNREEEEQRELEEKIRLHEVVAEKAQTALTAWLEAMTRDSQREPDKIINFDREGKKN